MKKARFLRRLKVDTGPPERTEREGLDLIGKNIIIRYNWGAFHRACRGGTSRRKKNAEWSQGLSLNEQPKKKAIAAP